MRPKRTVSDGTRQIPVIDTILYIPGSFFWFHSKIGSARVYEKHPVKVREGTYGHSPIALQFRRPWLENHFHDASVHLFLQFFCYSYIPEIYIPIWMFCFSNFNQHLRLLIRLFSMYVCSKGNKNGVQIGLKTQIKIQETLRNGPHNDEIASGSPYTVLSIQNNNNNTSRLSQVRIDMSRKYPNDKSLVIHGWQVPAKRRHSQKL